MRAGFNHNVLTDGLPLPLVGSPPPLLADQNEPTLSVDVHCWLVETILIVFSPSCYFAAHKLKRVGVGGG